MAALKQLPDDAPDFYSALVSDAAARPVVQEAVNDPLLDDVAEQVRLEVERIKAAVSFADTLVKRVYPLMWHCRGGESDLRFVQRCMRVIPDALKHEVSMTYESLFGMGGRKGRLFANHYLHGLASQFRGVSHEH